MLLHGLRGLRSLNARSLLAAAYAALFALVLRSQDAALSRLGLMLVVLLAGVAWLAALRRARATAELATSRIGSAAQGYVEVLGRASVEASNLVFSPLSGVQCIWYRYRVYSKDNAKREWREVDSGTSSSTFVIADPSGSCFVDPDHAEVMGPEVRTTYRDGNKLVEELLFGGTMIYVLGDFSTIGGAHTALSLREDVGALLGEWKQNQADLHRRFDLNRDGQINLHEWEQARRLATRTVEQQHREVRQQPGLNLVRAPADGRLFLISALAPERLRQRFLRWSWFHLGVGVLAVLLIIFKPG